MRSAAIDNSAEDKPVRLRDHKWFEMSGWFMFVATQGLLTSVALGALKKEGVIRFA